MRETPGGMFYGKGLVLVKPDYTQQSHMSHRWNGTTHCMGAEQQMSVLFLPKHECHKCASTSICVCGHSYTVDIEAVDCVQPV